MFEYQKLRDPSRDSALLGRIRDSSRAESQAAAERLVSIADLFIERLENCPDRDHWIVDVHEAVAAEVAATLRVSLGMGFSYLRYAMAMRLRLPKIGAVFEAGDIDYRLFQTVVFRTHLITDSAALEQVDAQLAARVARWPSMTRRKLSAKIDSVVAKVDPDAVRRAKEWAKDRFVKFLDTEAGMAELTARLFGTTGEALEKRLDELAATVCDGDPRTRDQRRADAFGVLVAHADRLGCKCGSAACPAGSTPAAPVDVVIHVVAEQATLDGKSQTPGVVAGSEALISAEVLRELAEAARRLPIITPADAEPERGYAPSRALADFVRCRDLTCRAPGCDQPAVYCDVDHTIPFDRGGRTHASNLKCLCRRHHLLKTFWGWLDEQLPDGTVIWTLPDGQRHVTTPGSALLFPALCVPTGTLPAPETPTRNRGGDRTAMMPRRTRTREQNTAVAIARERRRNRERRAACKQAMFALWDAPHTPDPNAEPPPF